MAMNILLLYATNSGGTQEASQILSESLSQGGHTVLMKEVAEVDPQDIGKDDLTILGSCTWDYQGEEGLPHEHFMEVIKKMEGQTRPEKHFAVFALGDSSYTHFCGAVDHLEAFVGKLQGHLILPSLKIDGFYFNHEKNSELLKGWAQKIAASLPVT